MAISLLNPKEHPRASLAISGHAGCGHSHSHCGFVQDDSAGLAAVLTILQRATGLDLAIKNIEVQIGKNGYFSVETVSGGRGLGVANRGITPFEANLAQVLVGRQAICTQTLAMTAFGRIYGQGAMESAVALQTAIANAAINSFAIAFPNKVYATDEGIDDNCGRILATMLDVNGIQVALQGVVNASMGGVGPNEDVEGNVDAGKKGALMHDFGMEDLPTLLVEGKVCANPVSPIIDEPTFLIRAYPGDDNPVVAGAYLRSALELDYPAMYREDLLARHPTALRDLTEMLGQQVIDLGEAFKKATTSVDKVRIASELNALVSQDLGGVTFMSEDVHHVMGGVGMIPGTCGCLSLFIPNHQLENDVIPALTEAEAGRFADVILGAVPHLYEHLDEAMEVVIQGKQRAKELSQ